MYGGLRCSVFSSIYSYIFSIFTGCAEDRTLAVQIAAV